MSGCSQPCSRAVFCLAMYATLHVPSPPRWGGREQASTRRGADQDTYSRRAAVFILFLFLLTGFVVKVERHVLSTLLPAPTEWSPGRTIMGRRASADLFWQRLFGSTPVVEDTRGLRTPSSDHFNNPADLIPPEEEDGVCKSLPDEAHQVTTRGLPPCPSSHQDFPMWAVLMIQPTRCVSGSSNAKVRGHVLKGCTVMCMRVKRVLQPTVLPSRARCSAG